MTARSVALFNPLPSECLEIWLEAQGASPQERTGVVSHRFFPDSPGNAFAEINFLRTARFTVGEGLDPPAAILLPPLRFAKNSCHHQES